MGDWASYNHPTPEHDVLHLWLSVPLNQQRVARHVLSKCADAHISYPWIMDSLYMFGSEIEYPIDDGHHSRFIDRLMLAGCRCVPVPYCLRRTRSVHNDERGPECFLCLIVCDLKPWLNGSDPIDGVIRQLRHYIMMLSRSVGEAKELRRPAKHSDLETRAEYDRLEMSHRRKMLSWDGPFAYDLMQRFSDDDLKQFATPGVVVTKDDNTRFDGLLSEADISVFRVPPSELTPKYFSS